MMSTTFHYDEYDFMLAGLSLTLKISLNVFVFVISTKNGEIILSIKGLTVQQYNKPYHLLYYIDEFSSIF